MHVSLIKEGRLITRMNFPGELPPRVRKPALILSERIAKGESYDDAESWRSTIASITGGGAKCKAPQQGRDALDVPANGLVVRRHKTYIAR